MNRALMLLLAAVLAVAGNAGLALPAWQRHQALAAQEADLAAQLTTAQGKIDALPALRVQIKTADAALAGITAAFPAEENLGVLVSRLQQATQAEHLAFSGLTRTSQPSPLPGFTEIHLTLAMSGPYADLYRFLTWTRDEKRVLSVTQLTTTTLPSGLNHSLDLTGYIRNPVTAEGAP